MCSSDATFARLSAFIKMTELNAPSSNACTMNMGGVSLLIREAMSSRIAFVRPLAKPPP
jgi:hypothetical protein